MHVYAHQFKTDDWTSCDNVIVVRKVKSVISCRYEIMYKTKKTRTANKNPRKRSSQNQNNRDGLSELSFLCVHYFLLSKGFKLIPPLMEKRL